MERKRGILVIGFVNDIKLDNRKYSGISPTLSVFLTMIDTTDTELVHNQLKKALYKGVKDRFKLGVHGQIINL